MAELNAARAERGRLKALLERQRIVRAAALDHTLAGWWRWDATTETFWLSPGCRRRLGLTDDAPLPPEMLAPIQALLRPGARRIDAMVTITTAAGPVRLGIRAAAVAFDADGRAIRWVGGNLDMQRLMEAEHAARDRLAAQAEDLARLNLELAAQAKQLELSNAALEDFAYAASHDLQVPLRAIAHFAEWIDEDLPPDTGEEVRAHVARLLNRVERLSQLHADLLAYARVAHTTVDWRAGEPMRAVYDSWARVGAATMALRVSGMTGACLVPAQQLAAILDQLLRNAIQHHDRPTGVVEVRIAHDGAELVIEVEDDGPGIEPRFADQAFKVLETLRPRDAGAGSGVGLSIARKHARRAGGEVRLAEREGRGAIFILQLPFRALQ